MTRPDDSSTGATPSAREDAQGLFWTAIAIGVLSILAVVALLAERNRLADRLDLAREQRDALLRYQDKLASSSGALEAERKKFATERKRLTDRVDELRRDTLEYRRALQTLTSADALNGAFTVAPGQRVAARYLISRRMRFAVVLVAHFPYWRRAISLQLFVKDGKKFRFLSTCKAKDGQQQCSFDPQRLPLTSCELHLAEGPAARATTSDRDSLAGLRALAHAVLPAAPPQPILRRPSPMLRRSPLTPTPRRPLPVRPTLRK